MKQIEYDRLLVESFYLRPEYKMWRICDFGEDIAELKRVPRHAWQFNMTISAFVCNYIPKLSESLFKRTVKDTGLIVKVLQKTNLDIKDRSLNAPKIAKEVREASTQTRKYRKLIKLAGDISDINRKANGCDWNTVKGFAVKQKRAR